jgi:hypothetical protein
MDQDTVGAFGFWLAIGLINVAVFMGPVGRALGRGIEAVVGRFVTKGPDREQAAELARLGERVEELMQVEQRLLEVEERLDFAERLLANQPRPGALPDGADTPPESVPVMR